ncbi:MAG: ferrous iron transport protein A [Verrucomicrobia bacterium]|nr:ferrous iron transport protein A [Verrucomicrobiota bacterium]
MSKPHDPCAAAGLCQHPDACPLNQVKAGTDVRVRQLTASPEVAHRLREMGFCEDQQIKLVSQQANVICQVCNVRLGISAELAKTIFVEPVKPGKKKAA